MESISLIDILAKPISAIIAISGVYLLNKRTKATEEQVTIANNTLKQAKLERVQDGFNIAIGNLSSTN